MCGLYAFLLHSCEAGLGSRPACLPAWLIRRFGSPDLTRNTLFTSQKHQSHSGGDWNADRRPTQSVNIYQLPATRAADRVLARVMLSVSFSCLKKWRVHHHTLGMEKQNTKTVAALKYDWNCQAEHPKGLWKALSVACGLWWFLASHRSTYIFYTGMILFITSAMHIQCLFVCVF